ncbi:MAG: NAD-dependent deacylase [Candidatus Sabulitectum sp.]|nr:NAD-dependent deacylase [Candidatus Sabulitectum sp.]
MRLAEAAELIKTAEHVTAFTGAGISVESGIPPFRGENGLWNKFDPAFLDISYFTDNPLLSWKLIKEIFYDFFGKAQPNAAHTALTEMESRGLLNSVITQNIDNLHQMAGSRVVYEFHGNSRKLVCIRCGQIQNADQTDMSHLPPKCPACGGVLKPDFVFFGEPIPDPAGSSSFRESGIADVFILIGTTGEIMPASIIPIQAKRNGARIIEVNTETTNYTSSIVDIVLRGRATEVMKELYSLL